MAPASAGSSTGIVDLLYESGLFVVNASAAQLHEHRPYVGGGDVVHDLELTDARGEDEGHAAVTPLLVVTDGGHDGVGVEGGHAHGQAEGGEKTVLPARRLVVG